MKSITTVLSLLCLQVTTGAAIQADEVSEYCRQRLAELQDLLDRGMVEEAVTLSHSFSREHNHEACTADEPFIGEGHFVSKVSSTPVSPLTGRDHQVSTHISMISSPNSDSPLQSTWIPVVQTNRSLFRTLNERSPVVGFSLNGEFILSDSPIKCAAQEGSSVLCDAGHHIRGAEFATEADAVETLTLMLKEEAAEHRRLSQSMIPIDAGKELIDATTAYAVGTKKILVILTCPSDSPNCGTQTFPYGYCYGKVSSEHGCASDGSGARAYVTQVMQNAGSFYAGNSWNNLNFQVTVTPPIKLPYKGGSCSSMKGLDYFSGKSSNSMDVMAYASAKNQGYDIANYDLNVVITPRCPDIGWSGVGWIGAPGALLYIYGYDHDASASHELGHNFGANHASVMTGGSRGTKAWKDSSTTWKEYGNPISVMGSGSAEVRDDVVVQGKIIFDWLPVSQVNTVSPFTASGGASCIPSCGPYLLQPTDTTKSSSSKIALQISTSTSNRFFFVEHRTKTSANNAAIITWSDITSSGRTGIYSNSVLADCTPKTTSFSDAGCLPGMSIVLDVGTASSSRKVIVVVGAVDSSGALRVEVSNDLNFKGTVSPSPPTVTPPTVTPPTVTPPTVTPPKENSVKVCAELGWQDKYGSAEVCGTSLGNGLGRCSGSVSWSNADAFCKFAGGRLCTVDELKNDEARGTGCSYDKEQLWTSSTCSNGHIMAQGSSTFGSTTSCGSDSAQTYARCCADASSASSVASCGSLGWPNVYGSADVCGASSGGGLGGCSGAVPWTRANSFCQNAGGRLCTVDELKNDEARGTGCSYDKEQLWTSSTCSNGHILAQGSSTYGSTTSCSTDTSNNYVRCCADVVGQQGDVAVHHVSHSFSFSYDVFSFDVSYEMEESYSFSQEAH